MLSLRRAVFFVLLLTSTLALLPAFAQQFDPKLFSEMRWRNIGPFRGGRTVAGVGVRSQPNVFYIGTSNGGVWKTTDYGRTWKPIFDEQPVGSIGAVAIAETDPNTIYVGSGEGMQRPDLATGNGMYKSTDGGATWRHLGLADTQQIAAVIVDPQNASRVFVAAIGHPYGANAERGVFRSLNGGATWEKVLFKDNDTGAYDVVFDPANPQIVYATLALGRRPPWTTGGPYVMPGGSIYKSTDGGTTWKQLTAGLPQLADTVGRIGLAIAPSNPKRIYARVDARKNGGLYRSGDAGESWQLISNDSRITGRMDDLTGIAVHPKDENTIIICSLVAWRSTDGGKTLTALKGAPGGDDYVKAWIHPEQTDTILLVADQGAVISVNNGATWSSWYNQPTAAFYHVATDNRFPYWVYGGQQDSGSIGTASRGDYGAVTWRDWRTVGVEEYGYVAPDPLNPDIIYGGKVTRFNHKTGDVQNVSPLALGRGEERFNRTAPVVFSKADPRALYFASQHLFKTTNGGKSWDIISPDLTRENPPAPATLGNFVEADPAKGKHRGVIYTIAPSPIDANLIWVGTDCGLVHYTPDGGKTWRNVTPPQLGAYSRVFMIDASHFDKGTAYVAVNRFRVDEWKPLLYRTRDFGKTWQEITRGLPADGSSNVVREDHERRGLLFAGTEREVYVSFNDGDEWQPLQMNLPRTSIRDLVIHNDDVVVGTHGRGFWILDDITPLRQMAAQVAQADAHLFKPQSAYRMQRSRNTDTPIPPEEPMGQNPPDGAILHYHLKAKAASPVTLEIFDSGNQLVRRYSSEDKAQPEPNLAIPPYWVRPFKALSAETGLHRFVWDLRHAAPSGLRGGFGGDYPISAIYQNTPRGPQGPLVAPGAYTVKLTVNGRSFTQVLTVKLDPRVTTSPEGLQRQFELTSSILAAMKQSNDALEQVKKLRAQLKEAQSKAGQGALAIALAELDQKAEAMEGRSGGGFAAFGAAAPGNTFTQINAQLGSLLGTIDATDEAPTSQVVKAAQGLQQNLTTLLAQWQALKNNDVTKLNDQLRQAGVSLLNP